MFLTCTQFTVKMLYDIVPYVFELISSLLIGWHVSLQTSTSTLQWDHGIWGASGAEPNNLLQEIVQRPGILLRGYPQVHWLERIPHWQAKVFLLSNVADIFLWRWIMTMPRSDRGSCNSYYKRVHSGTSRYTLLCAVSRHVHAGTSGSIPCSSGLFPVDTWVRPAGSPESSPCKCTHCFILNQPQTSSFTLVSWSARDAASCCPVVGSLHRVIVCHLDV